MTSKTDVARRVLNQVRQDRVARSICDALTTNDAEVYVVGGAVRDVVLGYPPSDFDLMARNVEVDRLRELLTWVATYLHGRVSEVGKNFGIFEVRCPDGCVQVSMPRLEHTIGHQHKDFEVHLRPEMSVEDDLLRRDFTCNAMAVGMDGVLHDPLDGFAHATDHTIAATSPTMIGEDPLRIVRGIGLTARRPMWIEPTTQKLMSEHAHTVAHLPKDRIRNELDKIFEAKHPECALRTAKHTGVLQIIIPIFADCLGYDQRNKHHELLLDDHMLQVLARVRLLTHDKDLRLAAFLHDVGKPRSAWPDPKDGRYHYYEGPNGEGADHEVVGAEMVYDWMREHNYSVPRISYVTTLVRHHMYGFETERTCKRLVSQVGSVDLVRDLITLRRADAGGKGLPDLRDDRPFNPDWNLLILNEVAHKNEVMRRDQLAIDGHDLMSIGFEAGRRMGDVLNSLLQDVIDDPALNDRDLLLDRARCLAGQE